MAGTIPTVVDYGIGLLSADLVLPRRRPSSAALVGLVDRQLVDDRRHARRRLRRRGAAARRSTRRSPRAPSSAGAYFGDKMTPLSETTVLVPSLVGGVTTQAARRRDVLDGRAGARDQPRRLPRPRARDADRGRRVRHRRRPQAALAEEFNISPLNLLPLVLLIVLSLRRAAAVPVDLRVARCSPASWPASRSGTRSRPSSTTRALGPVATAIEGDLRGDGQRVRQSNTGRRDDRRAVLPRRHGSACSPRSGWSSAPCRFAAIMEHAGFLERLLRPDRRPRHVDAAA